MSSRAITITLLAVIAVIIVVGSATIYYIGVYQPDQLHAQVVSTATAAAAGTVHANTISTAQTQATVSSQGSATANAIAQSTSVASATQIALQDVYNQATNGNPALNDSLSAQDNNQWSEGQNTDSSGNFFGSCQFAGGAYNAQVVSGGIQICQAAAMTFTNLTYQVQVNIVYGHSGGLDLRTDANLSGYYFRISTDGTYIFKKIAVVNNNANSTPLVSGHSSAIVTGNNQLNVLTVIAKGSTFYLYINQQYVNQVSDTTYKSGQIGVYIDSDAGGVEGAFHNAKVWKL